MDFFNEANTLFYKKSAENFCEALPIGNGKLGAMIYGRTDEEIIELNHDELWTGYPDRSPITNIKSAVDAARESCINGDYLKANEIIYKNSHFVDAHSYMPLGTLKIKMNHDNVQNYIRRLDLEKAQVFVEYDCEGVHYKREYLASFPEKVIAIRFTADIANLTFTVDMHSELRSSSKTIGNVLVLDGECFATSEFIRERSERKFIYSENHNERGIRYRGAVAVSTDGKLSIGDDSLTVFDAKEAVIYFSAESSFNGYDKHPFIEGKEYENAPIDVLSEALKKTFSQIRSAHFADYTNLYKRVSFDLNFGETDIPTDIRLQNYYDNLCKDNGLVGLIFNYGRYLTIAGSREGSMPLNLQGIWNNLIEPRWLSAYTTNINTEMNYFPTLLYGLTECYEPLLRFIKDISVTGEKTASEMYGARGFVCHHNSDIWCKTTPASGLVQWMYWPMASGWLCNHIAEYFNFTNDFEYMHREGFEIMEKAAVFYLDMLTEDEQGYLIMAPSTSPENLFLTNDKHCALDLTSTMTMSIITELFENIVDISEKIGKCDEVVEEIKTVLPRLLPLRQGSDGRLLEWYNEHTEIEVRHRHISHLYGLYPAHLISKDKNSHLLEACRRSLEMRGDKSTGWSLAWKIGLWAHLGDGNRAKKLIDSFLNCVTLKSEKNVDDLNLDDIHDGGVYPNLFCAHPPFQIDGNFGSASGICEMLLQSDKNNIYLLPALPDAWSDGSVRGLRAFGNIEVDIAWKNGRLFDYAIKGDINNRRVMYGSQILDVSLHKSNSL